jgi:plasmid stabilization system protein ParE
MAERSIVWTRTADRQFLEVLDYWLKRTKSNLYPKKLLDLVTKRTLQIAQQPHLYRLADFPDTRVASLGNFSIFYKVNDDHILITAFWDNRQDPEQLRQLLQGVRGEA